MAALSSDQTIATAARRCRHFGRRCPALCLCWSLLCPTNPGVATRKAGEILNLADVIAENDLVIACDGQTALGIGRVRGSYQYKSGLAFPHTRPVEWLSSESWQIPHAEGPRTTVFE